MHALTVNSAAVIFRKYELYSHPVTAKVDFDLEAAAPETRLWKIQVTSKFSLAIETALLAILGLIATGAGAYCTVQMINFANSDAITHAVGALVR
jgi:hypothetical protein